MQIPKPSSRIDDLARKIISVAEAIRALKPYPDHYETGDRHSDEDMRLKGAAADLFALYGEHVEEFEHYIGRYIDSIREWRNDISAVVSEATAHMGPLTPAPSSLPAQPSPSTIIKPASVEVDQSDLEKALGL